ncbi:MAG: S1 family peptidase [Chthoniobacteraceae bacterium]
MKDGAMKYTVYYIDDQSNKVVIEANTAGMAGWRFVAEHPRSDSSQLTVESIPSESHPVSRIIHYRACDLINKPVPRDEGEPELALLFQGGREHYYTVSGGVDSLRLLGIQLLRKLDELPEGQNPPGVRNVYGFGVVPGDGSSCESYLSFKIDPDLSKYRTLQRRFFRRENVRCLVLLVFTILAGIGLWTIAKWMM